MAIVFYSRLDSLTLDATHEYTAIATSWTSIGTTSFSSDAGFVGDGLLCSTNASLLSTGTVSSIVPTSAGSCGMMIRFPSTVPTFGNRIDIRNSGATEGIKLNINASSWRAQYVANGTTHNVQADVEISSNTWYGIVIRWDQPNSRFELEVYDSEATLLGNWAREGAITAWTGAVATMRVGSDTSATNPGHCDNFFVSDDPDEPIQNNFSINSITSYSSGAAVDLYPDVEPLYYGGSLLANKTNIQYLVTAGHAFINGAELAAGINATTDASGILQLPAPIGEGAAASDPVTLHFYFEEGNPAVDRSLIVKTTLVEDV